MSIAVAMRPRDNQTTCSWTIQTYIEESSRRTRKYVQGACVASEVIALPSGSIKTYIYGIQYMTRNFLDLEGLINRARAEWLQHIQKADTPIRGISSRLSLGRSMRTLILELASKICYSHSLDPVEDMEEAGGFWDSMEDAGPYGQYLYILSMLSLTSETASSTKKTLPKKYLALGYNMPSIAVSPLPSSITRGFPTSSAINLIVLNVVSYPSIKGMTLRNAHDFVHKHHSSSMATHSYLSRLPYLLASIGDSIRHFHPITQLRERMVPFVPSRTNIGLNTPSLKQHENFRPNPDTFRLECWLEEDDGYLTNENDPLFHVPVWLY
ncbi:uncharacterized protein BDR25DRAFT_347745 [Lindgomyces ingoldianus]|uniref:Uncharacterized protein n=1 Tax=Lindgomyces ingoldianus TaxID=673940 RepID=A0ACB6RE02_9PLEO|nr:uncharacterized protein BDR25DRAFT_347745 [Lindgomyces ingoldianus]KAF2477371.1 hypothetical protein BDR25DRAFT_347745 [Lindgomyces ingoldianus]